MTLTASPFSIDPLPLGGGFMLEPVSASHVPALWAVVDRDRECLRRTLSWLDRIQTEAECGQSMAALVDRCRQGASCYFAMVVEGVAAGLIGLDDCQSGTGEAELAWWLGVPYQGRGLTTRAGRVMLDLAWQRFGRQGLFLDMLPDNQPSRRVAEKLGFREQPEPAPPLEMYGAWRTRVRYHLARPQQT